MGNIIMALNKALFSSKNDNWRTPKDLFNILNKEFKFVLDAAADQNNALCENYYTEKNSGLINPWFGNVWCNPPYSKGLAKEFILKAVKEMKVTELIGDTLYRAVFLLPARTDTLMWQSLIFPFASEIRFLQGRLKFLDENNEEFGTAPFPSAIVVFSQDEFKSPQGQRISGWDWKTNPIF